MELTEIRDAVMERTGIVNPYTIDDAINAVQTAYIQPIERQFKTASHKVEDSTATLSDVADDIYRIDRVVKGKEKVPLLNPNDQSDEYGVRQEGDTLHFQSIKKGSNLEFHYEKKLKRLGSGPDEVTVPEIDEGWHMLYWMGAVAMLDSEFFQVFEERLERYRQERVRLTRPRAMIAKTRPYV